MKRITILLLLFQLSPLAAQHCDVERIHVEGIVMSYYRICSNGLFWPQESYIYYDSNYFPFFKFRDNEAFKDNPHVLKKIGGEMGDYIVYFPAATDKEYLCRSSYEFINRYIDTVQGKLIELIETVDAFYYKEDSTKELIAAYLFEGEVLECQGLWPYDGDRDTNVFDIDISRGACPFRNEPPREIIKFCVLQEAMRYSSLTDVIANSIGLKKTAIKKIQLF